MKASVAIILVLLWAGILGVTSCALDREGSCDAPCGGGAGGEAGGQGGSAGAGGQGGSAGAGGQGGSAGAGGQGGTAGAGGQGGSGGSYPTCLAGDTGTVDNISAQGVTRTGFLLHYDDSTEFYTQNHPALQNFNNKPMPGQMVLAGEDGFDFVLQNASTPEPKPWYRVSNFPNAECGGVDGFQTEACLSVVAKSFRCQYAPYLETLNCPIVTVNFAPETATDSHNEAGTGWGVILVDLTCP
jgi:hypothetical protein